MMLGIVSSRLVDQLLTIGSSTVAEGPSGLRGEQPEATFPVSEGTPTVFPNPSAL